MAQELDPTTKSWIALALYDYTKFLHKKGYVDRDESHDPLREYVESPFEHFQDIAIHLAMEEFKQWLSDEEEQAGCRYFEDDDDDTDGCHCSYFEDEDDDEDEEDEPERKRPRRSARIALQQQQQFDDDDDIFS